jgi:hypothetical protein
MIITKLERISWSLTKDIFSINLQFIYNYMYNKTFLVLLVKEILFSPVKGVQINCINFLLIHI